MKAFLASCRSAGIKPVENSLDCDAVVIWSVLWNGRMAKNQSVYEHYRGQGKPVIVIDVGALDREVTWKIAINNINATGYYGHQQHLDWDRPAALGLELTELPHKSDSILLALQHRKSLQWENMPDLATWTRNTITNLRKYTDRPIIVRPHPRSPAFIPPHRFTLENFVNCTIEKPDYLANTYDKYNIDYGHHVVVNYCSGPGISAAIAGASVLTDSSSLAHPVSTHLEHIENPKSVDREQWFVEICHTEYTVEEIEQGLWLKRLKDLLE